MSIYEKQLDEEIIKWSGEERRLACQGCSAVYSKLLKSEKLNLEAHKELYRLNFKKISKRNFFISIIIIVAAFVLSFKFRSDFELRYINSLDTANKNLQSVIYNLDDLISSIEAINKKIIFTEDNFDDKIFAMQKEIQQTRKTINDLKKRVNSKGD